MNESKQTTDYRLYILTRTDLPSMNPGKAAAQVGHACNAFVYENPPDMNLDVFEWQNQTEQGFGTTITLSVTFHQLLDIQRSLCSNARFEIVNDPTYPYIVNSEVVGLITPDIHRTEPIELESGDFLCTRHETTCAYYFGDANDEEFRKAISDLPLLP